MGINPKGQEMATNEMATIFRMFTNPSSMATQKRDVGSQQGIFLSSITFQDLSCTREKRCVTRALSFGTVSLERIGWFAHSLCCMQCCQNSRMALPVRPPVIDRENWQGLICHKRPNLF